MKKTNIWLGIVSVAIILIFIAIIIIPATNTVFTSVTKAHPLIMGFVKFAFLATVGEILATRLRMKAWYLPSMLWLRFLIWGLLGVWITFMMNTLSAGVDGLIASSFLPNFESGMLKKLVRAFYISAIMNTTFGPTFMALHKITDTWIDRKVAKESLGVSDTVKAVNWSSFVSFTVLKCVPFFWIPAHTITFMLPGEYQVMLAAFLSIALGVLLSFKKSK